MHVEARTKVARVRLTQREYEKFERDAKAAGIKPSEYLRGLIVRMPGEVEALWARVEHLSHRVDRLESLQEEQ